MAERNRREQILQAAKALFKEKGYHGTTIRDIAEQSGVLSGSLYAHIKTKEDLLFEITNEVADHFVQRLEKVVASPWTPPDKFRAALAVHIQVVAEHLDAASVFSHEWKALSYERRAIIQEKRDQYEALWARILEEGVNSGHFYPEHLRFSRIVTLSVANWLYQWFQPGGKLSAKQVADELATVLLRGVQMSASPASDSTKPGSVREEET
jgi:TetR/AcrR family transcriptional regulator, cholesterol catabolism regulator